MAVTKAFVGDPLPEKADRRERQEAHEWHRFGDESRNGMISRHHQNRCPEGATHKMA